MESERCAEHTVAAVVPDGCDGERRWGALSLTRRLQGIVGSGAWTVAVEQNLNRNLCRL